MGSGRAGEAFAGGDQAAAETAAELDERWVRGGESRDLRAPRTVGCEGFGLVAGVVGVDFQVPETVDEQRGALLRVPVGAGNLSSPPLDLSREKGHHRS